MQGSPADSVCCRCESAIHRSEHQIAVHRGEDGCFGAAQVCRRLRGKDGRIISKLRKRCVVFTTRKQITGAMNWSKD
ncbi:hypothetical protein MATL_G00101320 [Megalops atlanticus]|uniref:Uncharacterized protein n=1 Tax=Megalops atlanticus TaxID=7932 RepID=A0A9D3TDI5_MEGAT|nr:hypothetical protein MATL_G00101320 [Megalops atlanticus]